MYCFEILLQSTEVKIRQDSLACQDKVKCEMEVTSYRSVEHYSEVVGSDEGDTGLRRERETERD